jgi:hypothetical protein
VKKFFQKSLKDAVNTVYNPQFNVKLMIYPPFLNGSDLLINLKKTLNLKDDAKEISYEIKKTMKAEMCDHFGILFDPIYRFDTFVV